MSSQAGIAGLSDHPAGTEGLRHSVGPGNPTMRRAALAGILATLVCHPFPAGAILPPLTAYLGSDGCAHCHPKRHDGWRRTYHFSVVADPSVDRSALRGDFTQEAVGFGPESVEFTIGGHWYQRYATRVGGQLYVLPKMWSVASHRWESVDDWSWKQKPYNTHCVGCHATRYDAESGAYVEHRVGCEACHGPGRAHAESGGTASIVNPSRWSPEEQELLCAACHVRGADPSGRFPFALGYAPGETLTEYYRPFRGKDGESAQESLLRQYRNWRGSLGKGPPPSCDVCGIRGDREPKRQSTGTDPCLSCHRYGAEYTAHTRHPQSLELECSACHGAVELVPGARPYVHPRGYLQVHDRTRYEPAAAEKCLACHSDMPAEEADRLLASWDHSFHLRTE